MSESKTIYQNPELLEPTFFLRDDFKKIAKIGELADQPLNRDIYFNPTSRLKISRSDSRLGSCFVGWQIPTSGIMVEATGYINMNTLISFKNLQCISDLINISATLNSITV